MNRQSSSETEICEEYQRLLEECENALKTWKAHRDEFRFRSREAGDKLLRLQANYARAYSLLQNHKRDCAVCQLVARANATVFEKGKSEFSDKETWA